MSEFSSFPLLVNDNFTQMETVLNFTNNFNDSLIDILQINLAVKKHIDTSKLIGLKENDWRDAHNEKMIIWSVESRWHPEFGKNYPKGDVDTERLTRSSQMMSFMILGSVIGFILYTYLGHVLMVKRLNREEKARRVREMMRRSAMMFVDGDQVDEENERKRSLINMFKGFKL